MEINKSELMKKRLGSKKRVMNAKEWFAYALALGFEKKIHGTRVTAKSKTGLVKNFDFICPSTMIAKEINTIEETAKSGSRSNRIVRKWFFHYRVPKSCIAA